MALLDTGFLSTDFEIPHWRMKRKKSMYIWSKCTGKGYGYFALKISNLNYNLLNDKEKSKINVLREFSDCKVISISKSFYYKIIKKYDFDLPR